MTTSNKIALALALALSTTSFFSQADTVSNAYAICQAVESTGALSEDCKISGWNQAIDLSLEMTSPNAKKFCIGVSDLAKKQRMKFDEGWKIRIYSPYSNGKTIATCKLPT